MTEQELIKIAQQSGDQDAANKAMAQLKKFWNPSYHWCDEWDDLVICNTDLEFKACTCTDI